MQTIYCLVGPPCAGKSTWTKAHLASATIRTTVVGTDDIIEEYASANGLTYSEAFQKIDFKEAEKEMFRRLREALERKDDVIVDRTNVYTKARNKILSQVPNSYRRVAMVFEVPRDELNRRLKARAEATGKFIPPMAVSKMINDYQPPQDGEFDEIITISYEAQSV